MDHVKSLLEEECATNITYVPGKHYSFKISFHALVIMLYILAGCTSLVQPLDVNKPFKAGWQRNTCKRN